MTCSGVTLLEFDDEDAPRYLNMFSLEPELEIAIPLSEVREHLHARCARYRRRLRSERNLLVGYIENVRPTAALVHWLGAPSGRFGAAAHDDAVLPSEQMPLADLTAMLERRSMMHIQAGSGARIKSSGRACRILRTYTKADVRWQDGRIDREIVSTKLMPVEHLLDQDLFPGDYVCAAAAESDGAASAGTGDAPQPQPSDAERASGVSASANLSALDSALDALLDGAERSDESASDERDQGDRVQLDLDRRLGVVMSAQHKRETCNVLWLDESAETLQKARSLLAEHEKQPKEQQPHKRR